MTFVSSRLRVSGVLALAFLAVPVGRAAFAQNPPAAAVNPTQQKIFFSLLRAYKRFPEQLGQLDKGAATFDDVDLNAVAGLPPKVLESRFGKYNPDYLADLRIEKKTAKGSPRAAKVREVIFMLSVDANMSVLEALRTLPAKKLVAKAKPHPKMPGKFEGSKEDRKNQPASEKKDLTPVDDEFYKTQLGKKLESDLGGRADSWSYDEQANEVYVATGDDVSKVRVKQDTPGVNYIQTRGGDDFVQPIGTDTKVDMLQAQGSFLTGDPRASLFGKMPSANGGLGGGSGGGSAGSTEAPTTETPSVPAGGGHGH